MRGSFKGIRIHREWRAEHQVIDTEARQLHYLLHRKPSHWLHRNAYSFDDCPQFFQRIGWHSLARRNDRGITTLVETNMVNDEVDSFLFHHAGGRGLVFTPQVIAHYLHAVIAAGFHNRPESGWMSPCHHHHVRGPRFGHHFSLEITAIHRLEVCNQGITWKF